jgi:hypothetical protein
MRNPRVIIRMLLSMAAAATMGHPVVASPASLAALLAQPPLSISRILIYFYSKEFSSERLMLP